MTAIFLKLLNMSITASWLVLAVIVLRLLLKKAPKAITCALWGLVAIRLLCPFSIESVFSLIPSAEPVSPEIVHTEKVVLDSPVETIVPTVTPSTVESVAPTLPTVPTTPEVSVDPVQIALTVASVVWILGILAMAAYALVSYLRLRKKVAEAVEIDQDVFLCDRVDTPFILGIFRPHIYLPSAIEDRDMEYVLAHERAHLRRRDHFWKPLGFALLTVYWFNPILWVAYILLCRDIELACDECVIRDMGVEDKKAYTSALLNCSVPRKMIVACPLAFGEVGVKQRIKSALHYKKPAFWIIVVAVLASIAVAVGFLTDPKDNDKTITDYRSLVAYAPKANGVFAYAYSEEGRKLLELYEEPLRKFESKEELDAFRTEFADVFVMDATYNGIPSFNSTVHDYDADFFAKNVLFLWYTESTSGTCRYHVDGIERDGEKLTINIEVENAIEVNDYRDWFLFVSVKKDEVEGCTEFAVQTYADGVLSYRQAPYYSAEVAYAGVSSDSSAIYTESLNSEKLFIDGPEHLPIYKFETVGELDTFKAKYTDVLSLTEGYGEIPPFAEVTETYDDAFFKEYFLFAIYRRTANSDDRYTVAGTYVGDSSLTVHVQQITYGTTQEEIGLFLLVAVDNKYAPYCSEFDAYMVYDPAVAQDPIVGTWSTKTVTDTAEDFVLFTFNANGSGEKITPTGENGYIASTFIYETKNDILTLWYPSAASAQYTYAVEDGYLTLQQGDESITLSAPLTDSELLGTWQTGWMRFYSGGKTATTRIALTFYANGTGFESGHGTGKAFVYAANGETVSVTYTSAISDGEMTAFGSGSGLALGEESTYTFTGSTLTIARADTPKRNETFIKVPQSDALVGEWTIATGILGLDPEDVPDDPTTTFTFNEDGTGLQSTNVDGVESQQFAYSFENGRLTLTYFSVKTESYDTVSQFLYTLRNNTLTLSDVNDPKRSMTLTRAGENAVDSDAQSTDATNTTPGDAVFTAKLFANGETATLHVTETDAQTVKLSACKNGTEVWSTTLGTAHAGWSSFHLCKQDGQDYLLEYSPTMYQGRATYTYTLFCLSQSGDAVKRASNTLEFDINFPAAMHVDAIVAFVDEVNALLENSELIVSTLSGDKQIGSAAAPVHMTETLSWLDEDGIRYADGASLREKLTQYIEANKYKTLAKAESYDVEVLAVADEITYTEFLLKVGEKEKSFSGMCLWQDASIEDPKIYVEDLTHDGYPEITVIFAYNRGVCVYQEDIHIFDSRTLEEYEVEKVYDTIGNYVDFSSDKEAFYIQTTDGMHTIQKQMFAEDYDAEEFFDRPATDMIYRYSVSNGALHVSMTCQITISGSYGAVVADYAFENGKFVYKSSSFSEPQVSVHTN